MVGLKSKRGQKPSLPIQGQPLGAWHRQVLVRPGGKGLGIEGCDAVAVGQRQPDAVVACGDAPDMAARVGPAVLVGQAAWYVFKRLDVLGLGCAMVGDLGEDLAVGRVEADQPLAVDTEQPAAVAGHSDHPFEGAKGLPPQPLAAVGVALHQGEWTFGTAPTQVDTGTVDRDCGRVAMVPAPAAEAFGGIVGRHPTRGAAVSDAGNVLPADRIVGQHTQLVSTGRHQASDVVPTVPLEDPVAGLYLGVDKQFAYHPAVRTGDGHADPAGAVDGQLHAGACRWWIGPGQEGDEGDQ